ncbi:MAG: flagellar biosynthesis anti-sigma factor FlgM [Bryobacteraceae bacterium]
MKIHDRSQPGTGATQGTGRTEAVESQGTAGVRRGRVEGDSAELSGLAGKVAETITGESPERLARLESLRAVVASGRYQVDAQAVSKKLVDEALAPDVQASGKVESGQ